MKIETDAVQYGLLRAVGFAQVAYAQDLTLPVDKGRRKRLIIGFCHRSQGTVHKCVQVRQ